MKFITKKTSVTGQKFVTIFMKMQECEAAARMLAKELGVVKWTRSRVAGGMVAVQFYEGKEIEKCWNKIGDFYKPDQRYKKGKEIWNKMQKLPVVYRRQLNMCIGFNSVFHRIGVVFTHDEYIGIEINESWEIEMPEDCEEVTTEKFNQIFKNE